MAKVKDFTQDDKNMNKGTDKGQKLMRKSLKKLGAGRSVLADKNGVLIAGNKTQQAALEAGIEEAIVVHTTGDKLVVVQRDDIDINSAKGRELAFADNQTNKENLLFDDIAIAEVAQQFDLDLPDWGYDLPDLAKDFETTDNTEDTDNEDEEDEEKFDFANRMLGDFLYDADNDFDIPNLLMEQQPVHLELPITPWGANSRLRTDVTTYHFYVDDYRFTKLFSDPVNLIMSGCKAIVEPNCSLHDQLPTPIGLERIYRKRYLSRYVQECGIKVWVDLNVADKFVEFNKMGVPKGYNAFFTRGMAGEWAKAIENEYKVAQEISGREHPNMVCYGGGLEVKKFCKEHGILYFADFMMKQHDSIFGTEYADKQV